MCNFAPCFLYLKIFSDSGTQKNHLDANKRHCREKLFRDLNDWKAPQIIPQETGILLDKSPYSYI